jgi:hypothetical protein
MGGIVGGEGTFGTGAAGGGSVVAFQEGGRSMFGRYLETPGPMGFFDFVRQGSQPTEKQQILKEIEKAMPRPFESLSDEEYNKRMQRVKELQALVAASPEQRLRSQFEGGPTAQALPSTAQAATAAAAVPTQAPSGIATLPADTGGVPTQTLAGIEEAQAAQKAQKDQAAAVSPLNYIKMMEQAGNMAERDTGRGDIKTAKQQMQSYDDLLKDAGFDFNIVKDQMKELAKEKEEVKGGKKEAINLRLLEAGLGILGGESPYAFVNIGKGATPALQGLAKDIKDIQKESRLLDKESRQLSMMQNQMAEGRAKFGQAQVNRQEDKVERIEDRIAADKRSMFQTITSSETQKQVAAMQQQTQQIAAGALKMERDLARTDARARSALEQATDFVEKSMKLSPPEEQAAEVKRLFRQFYGAMYGENKELGSGRAQGKVVNGVYVPAGQ